MELRRCAGPRAGHRGADLLTWALSEPCAAAKHLCRKDTEIRPGPRSYLSDTPIDLDYLGTPHFEFDGQWGSMRFARLMGNLDCRYSGNKVDFCWRGDEDMKELSGRGVARFDGAVLRGELFTYGKADVSFVGRRFRDGESMDLSTREKFDEG